jgi:hypothetical protein
LFCKYNDDNKCSFELVGYNIKLFTVLVKGTLDQKELLVLMSVLGVYIYMHVDNNFHRGPCPVEGQNLSFVHISEPKIHISLHTI